MGPRAVTLDEGVSFVARFVASALLPAWGLICVALSLAEGNLWWFLTGITILAFGVVVMMGNPIIMRLTASAQARSVGGR